jgi:hypothetical protein
VPGLDVLSISIAVVSVATGAMAARQDYRDGTILATSMDIAGMVPGLGALGVTRYARMLEGMAEAAGVSLARARSLEELMAASDGLWFAKSEG